jgi:hypothetical protein
MGGNVIILRGLGVALAFFLTFAIAKLSNIEVMNMMVLVSFILIVDSLVTKYISHKYL